jgi:hypothetical protein
MEEDLSPDGGIVGKYLRVERDARNPRDVACDAEAGLESHRVGTDVVVSVDGVLEPFTDG